MSFFGTKKKAGWVYFAESTRKDGTKKIYTGKTSRPVTKRWGEHIGSVKSPNKKTWVSKGKYFKPLGAIWSSNVSKAERTIKRMSPEQKRAIAREGARRYKKKSY